MIGDEQKHSSASRRRMHGFYYVQTSQFTLCPARANAATHRVIPRITFKNGVHIML